MEKINVLVTGGAGFMGSHIVDELIKNNFGVVVLDDLSGGFVENVNREAFFVNGSIADQTLLIKLFEEHRFSYVFHLAAYAAEGLSHFIRHFNYENNLIGSANLINCSVNYGVKRFVFTSSIAVYGPNQVPMKEELVPEPEDPYGIAKFAVELDLKAAEKLFGLEYVIFRPHNVYGERQNIGDKYRNVIGIFMNKIMRNEPLPIFGDGEQVRAFSHISDIVPVIVSSITNDHAKNQIFNIGADVPYTINVLAETVARSMESELKVVNYPPRNEVKIAYSDHSKAKSLLGYEAKVSLEEGIARMAEWAKKVGAKESSRFEGIEIEKNLPSVWLE
jgi:UDP-glucose 4-epimerase